jgi:prophage DNA circulation protein
MDTTAFLLIIIVLVAAILIAVGIYLILVLNETRKSLRRLNNIFGHIDSLITILDEKVARPATSVVGVVGVVKDLVDVLRDLKGGRKGYRDEPPE